jgi:poly(A) polymerase
MTPAGKLPTQEWMRAPETRRVIEAVTAGGAEARFVGGCVRDALAGRKVQDIDIATRLPPEEVMGLLRAAGIKAVPTGLAHGTVTAVVAHKPFEITTLREDVETYGRRAKVAFTDDWTADAARRDFTFNALSCAPDGTLYDPFGGIDDLRAGRVRFVGDARARIQEDYLRLLRLFRFQALYGREPLEPAVLAIARELAPELGRLSGERVRVELFKLLQAEDPAPVVELMMRNGVLRYVLPVARDAAVLRALMRAEEPGRPPDPVLRLAAILEPEPGNAGAAAERLRLSNRQRYALTRLLEPLLDPRAEMPAKERHRALRKMGPALSRDLLRLAWAQHQAGRPAAVPDARFAAALDQVTRLAETAFPLQGRDVLALGVREGPELGRLLEAVEEWWAERDFAPSRKDCLARLRELVEMD